MDALYIQLSKFMRVVMHMKCSSTYWRYTPRRKVVETLIYGWGSLRESLNELENDSKGIFVACDLDSSYLKN